MIFCFNILSKIWIQLFNKAWIYDLWDDLIQDVILWGVWSDAFVLLKIYVVLGQSLMNFKNLFLSKLSELCMVNLAKEIWYKRRHSPLIFIIFLSWFVFLYINDYLMIKSQSAFWIFPSLTFEIAKSQMEEKQKSIILWQIFLF